MLEANQLADTTTSRPLLTIVVPTYNRAKNLDFLLSMLQPQLAALPQIELMVLDNCSPDETPAVVQAHREAGLHFTAVRHARNIGPDANFTYGFDHARGQYVWIFGDDDVIFPGSLDRLVHLLASRQPDLLYLAPFGFVHQPTERRAPNPSATCYEATDPIVFLKAAGMFGDLILTSSCIINKDTVQQAPHRPFTDGASTNLVQLGWTYTALQRLRRGLIFEPGLYAVCEHNPSRPFDLARVFGVNLHRMATLFLEQDATLRQEVLREQMRAWFVTNWYGSRRGGFLRHTMDPVGQLRPLYGGMPQFWIHAWPLISWPMLPAGGWLALLRTWRKAQRRATLRRLQRVPT